MKTPTVLRAILFGSCAVLALVEPALANEAEDLRALIEQQKVQIDQQKAQQKAQMEQQRAQMEQQTKLLNRLQSRLDQIDRGQPVESVADINKRLDALENRQSAAAAKSVVAPADAVVGGDFPGSFKLPGSDTSMAFHGYTKLDLLYDIKQPTGDAFAVSTIAPNGTPSERRGPFVRLHARESRLDFETRTPTNFGQLNTLIEGNFFGGGATQDTLNGTGFVLRLAYGELGPFRAGQDWSTFQILPAYPEILDFSSHPGGVFIRQAQLRYTQHFGKFTFMGSLENPSGDFRTDTGQTPDASIPKPSLDPANKVDRMPDLVARVGYLGALGDVEAAGIIRRFDVDNGGGGETGLSKQSDDAIGGGGVIAGRLNAGYFLPALGKDEIGFEGFYGSGIGRYVNAGGGLNASAVVKNFGTPAVRIETQPQFGGSVWYRHWWTENLRSNLFYAIQRQHLSDTIPQSNDLTDRIQEIHGNLIWSPVKNVNLGVEAIFGTRDIRKNPVTGLSQTGDAERVQVSAQYLF